MLRQDTVHTVRVTCHFPSYRAPVPLRSVSAASSNFTEIPISLARPTSKVLD